MGFTELDEVKFKREIFVYLIQWVPCSEVLPISYGGSVLLTAMLVPAVQTIAAHRLAWQLAALSK